MAQSHPSRNDSITSTIARIIFAEFLISSTVIRVFASSSAFVLGFRFGLGILLTSSQSLVRLSYARLERDIEYCKLPVRCGEVKPWENHTNLSSLNSFRQKGIR